ncbi:MAG: SGNH/GDSL hydrolase family protein [Lachnospiraceae bacterium]|nr:SGNH/GDSL hydrolase family protein [Lachnospiraceae bacterium]
MDTEEHRKQTGSGIGSRRMRDFLKRAAAGEALTVAFFGGSITQGSLASSEETCYAYQFYTMLRDHFPKAELTYVNAGIGGTGSHYGAMRVREDLLAHRPDLVVVDFSVNDTEAVLPLYQAGEVQAKGDADWGTADRKDPQEEVTKAGAETALKLYPETWEGVLRRILLSESRPAILVLNNAFYDTGVSVEDEHNAIADRYGIPHMSVRDRILPRIRRGEYTREELSPDGLHPNDKGHRLIAEELMQVVRGFEDLSVKTTDEPVAEALPAPYTANGYEHTERLDVRNREPVLAGFTPDRAPRDAEADRYDFFRNGWTAAMIGDRLSIDVEGSGIAVVYRKTIHRPSPVARLVLDGDEAHAVLLDGNFDQDWGDCLFLQPILHHGTAGTHHIDIEIIRATPGDLNPFYLLSIGVSG